VSDSVRFSFNVPAARRDELIAELWALGTRGIHQPSTPDGERLEAYFDASRSDDLAQRRTLWEACGATLVETADVEPEDWLAVYRARSRPVVIGPFVIDPREPELETPASPVGERDALTLRIPARNAFGTGSHESTRLILEALVDLDVQGRTVLDVGTGSGILALSAVLLGAGRVVGFDIDSASVVTARANAKLNRLAPVLFAGQVSGLRARFDTVLVNILPQRWIEDAAAVADRLRGGGDLIVSGLLADQSNSVIDRLAAHGLEYRSSRALGEWAVLRFRSPVG
jgi:ribosomal protein L11 methyltransferase